MSGTYVYRPALAWARVGLIGTIVAVHLAACATTGGDWRTEPPLDDSDLLAVHLGLPRVARVELADDGSRWVALGAAGHRIARWEGVPAGLPCAEVAQDQRGAHWQVRGAEPPAVLRLDADTATIWAMDSAQGCAVEWELFKDAEPEGDPVLQLALDESAGKGEQDELPDDGEESPVDGAEDEPEAGPTEDHGEADLTSAPGLERVSLDLDRILVTGQDGGVLLDYPLGVELLDPEVSGSREITLDVERLAQDRILLRFSLDQQTEGYDDTPASATEESVWLWQADSDAAVEDLRHQRGWSSSETSGACGGSSSSEGEELTRRFPVPAGVLIQERRSDVRAETAEVCDDTPTSVCSVTTTTFHSGWSWVLELLDGTSEELGTGESESSETDSGCSQ